MAFALARKYEQKKNTKKYCHAKKKYCKKILQKRNGEKRNCEMGKENKANFIMQPWGGSREKRKQDMLNLNYENHGCCARGGGGMGVGVGVAVDF